jgi:hypothetical protein
VKRSVKIRITCAIVASCATLSNASRAEPESITGAYSEYEVVAIQDAEEQLGAKVDPSPEGKTIERIDFVRIDPVDAHDPLPRGLDAVHTTSKEYVIRRAILVEEGQPFRALAVDESARNLRRLPQLSVVLCVAMAGSSPDRVRLVVITKDVWSLYVDFNLSATSGGLESLTLEPKESNIAGTHHAALGHFILEPRTVTVGAGYAIPRLDGRWISVVVDANAVINRDTGSVEGGFGFARVERPLFSSHTEWAWSTGTVFGNRLRRRYVNAEVASFEPAPADGTNPVPWVWRERVVTQDAKITRSYGWATKNDFSVGAALSHTRNEVPGDPSIDPRSIAAFRRDAVPVGEDRGGPFVQWHGYRTAFLRTFDFDTLGLQEDLRLGHDLWIRLYPVLRALGSTRDLFGTYAAAAQGFALGDGVARVSAEAIVEATTGGVTDASLQTSLGIATPRFGPRAISGRIVFNASLLTRFENYLNAQSFLGGDTLLRGYPTRYFAGRDVFTTNLEYRTRSYNLSAVQVGAAAFYDVGDAFTGFDRLDPKQSAGGGLRIVFPQVDRAVLRIDCGVPLFAPAIPGLPPLALFISFNQALVLPSVGEGRGP